MSDTTNTSPFLTSAEAAVFLRYRSLSGFMRAVHRVRIPYIMRGKTRLYLKTDLIRVWKAPIGYRPRKSTQDAEQET